ncbi:hypothetical protein KCP69_15645 [Salmonella enterica subsp. enterica]|nr:hypothetical protein KCP69_15645 [Salmonella enterica subsp. enterica]
MVITLVESRHRARGAHDLRDELHQQCRLPSPKAHFIGRGENRRGGSYYAATVLADNT